MQLYTYTRRNILNTITTSEDTSLEKYTSHFIESVVCERELKTDQRLQHIDLPRSSGHSSVFFSFSWAAQLGDWGLALCWKLVFTARSRTLLQTLNCNCSIGGSEGPLCWVLFFLQHPISNSLELPAHRVILLLYAHRISSHNLPTEYATSAVFGMACLAGSEVNIQHQHSLNRVSGISTCTMNQSTIPSLSETIWPRWASTQFLSLPRVQTLLPVTFAYSLSPEAVVMRQLRRWKRLWRRLLTRSHKRTSMRPSRSCLSGTTIALQTEELTSKGTRVSWVYYQ